MITKIDGANDELSRWGSVLAMAIPNMNIDYSGMDMAGDY